MMMMQMAGTLAQSNEPEEVDEFKVANVEGTGHQVAQITPGTPGGMPPPPGGMPPPPGGMPPPPGGMPQGSMPPGVSQGQVAVSGAGPQATRNININRQTGPGFGSPEAQMWQRRANQSPETSFFRGLSDTVRGGREQKALEAEKAYRQQLGDQQAAQEQQLYAAYGNAVGMNMDPKDPKFRQKLAVMEQYAKLSAVDKDMGDAFLRQHGLEPPKVKPGDLDFGEVSAFQGLVNKAIGDDFSARTAAVRDIATLTQEDTAIADHALIFRYLKMLDPGSTVREGEFATVEQARGLPQEWVGLFNKALEGEKLTPDQRSQLADMSFTIYTDAAEEYETRIQPYKNRYADAGRDWDREISAPTPYDIPDINDMNFGDVPKAAQTREGPNESDGGPNVATATGALPRVQTPAERDALPIGTEYIAPNGERMIKR